MASLHSDCQRWVEHLKAASQGRRDYRALELLYRAGSEPRQCHPVMFSFWAVRCTWVICNDGCFVFLCVVVRGSCKGLIILDDDKDGVLRKECPHINNTQAALLPTTKERYSPLRMELMECRSTRERLTRVQQHLQGAIESYPAEGCSVM